MNNNYLEEVWFPGVHENVGGQEEAEITFGLSKISLDWMVSRFKDYQIFPDNSKLPVCGDKGPKCEDGQLQDQFFDNPMWKAGRVLRRRPRDGDLVHGSVFCRKNITRLSDSHKVREPDGKYITLNLKKEEHYQKVPYNCVN